MFFPSKFILSYEFLALYQAPVFLLKMALTKKQLNGNFKYLFILIISLYAFFLSYQR